MKSKINQAIKYIIDEKLVALPTDTFFALSANGLSTKAIEKIYYAKGRDYSSPIPLLISSQDMAMDISKNLSDLFFKITEKFWPGPLTVVVDANGDTTEDSLETATEILSGINVSADALLVGSVELGRCHEPGVAVMLTRGINSETAALINNSQSNTVNAAGNSNTQTKTYRNDINQGYSGYGNYDNF